MKFLMARKHIIFCVLWHSCVAVTDAFTPQSHGASVQRRISILNLQQSSENGIQKNVQPSKNVEEEREDEYYLMKKEYVKTQYQIEVVKGWQIQSLLLAALTYSRHAIMSVPLEYTDMM